MAQSTPRKKASRGQPPRASAHRSTLDESPEETRKRVRRIITKLKKDYPEANCALVHDSAFELLIATILSAQSTDETVNKVTPILLDQYPTPADLARARPADVEKIIYPTGFYRQKTKSIIGTAQGIVEQFEGQVPDELDALITLPGVARKTANVVLGTAFGKNEGVVVDTHVGRIAMRLGLSPSAKNDKDAVKIERDLCAVVPRKEWTYLAHALIWHGRKVCSARKPQCSDCRLRPDCPAADSFDA